MFNRYLSLFLFIIVLTFEISAQNFSGGFNFNMPGTDTSTGSFLPAFPVKAITNQDFISINSDGNFTANGKPVRFWGTNLVGDGAFPDRNKASYIAGRLRKMGFNLVRFHHIDNPWSQKSLVAGGTTTREINLTNLDYMENLIAELKKNGIYANINLNVSRTFKKADGIAEADSLPDYAKGFTIFDPQMIALQKEYAYQLLTHRNKYTGFTLAEDPVMAVVELINENSLYMIWRNNKLKLYADGGILPVRYNTMLDTMFNRFLMNKYGSTQNLQTSWNAGTASGSSPNLIINGDFENTSNSNWYMELHNGAAAAMTREISNPYNGLMSAKVTVSAVTGTDWHIQWEQYGFSLQNDSLYTIEFAARSDSSRTISVGVMRHNDPYTGYGSKDFALTTQWKKYTLTFKPSENNNAQSRFTVSFKNSKGTFWFDDISLTLGGTKGLLAGESLESKTVKRIDYADCTGFSDQRVKDMSAFYIKLHDDFYSEMKSFLKNICNVKVPVIGTNWNFGPGDLISQSKYDFVDNHAYWQHPNFPGVPWSSTDWNITNTPMVRAADAGTMPGLFGGVAMIGKPYTVSEYNHPFPNRYQTEMMLFSAAYLSFHNADGIELFDYNGSNDFESDFIPGYFDISRNPALMSLSPSCAFAYRNNYIARAKETLKLKYNPGYVYLLPKNNPGQWWGIDLFPKKLALIHAVKNESFTSDSTTDFSKLPPEPVSPYKTDTDEITWNSQGLLTVNTARFIGATGFLDYYAGTKTGLMQIKAANDFGTITWVSITGDSLLSARKSLITVSSKSQNTAMIWDGITSVHNNWGKSPTQMFPLNLTLRLNINADSIKIYALDAFGNEKSSPAQTYYPLAQGIFEIILDQNSDRTLWFGIENFSKETTAVKDDLSSVKDFRLEQNYPNPFNGTTTIKYYVPYESHVKIDIFDALGRQVKTIFDDNQPQGVFSLKWEGKNNSNEEVNSGVYFVQLKSGGFVDTKKLLLLK